jgi:hypothetical protein
MSQMASEFERPQSAHVLPCSDLTDLSSSPSRRSIASSGSKSPLRECEMGRLLRLAALCRPYD